MIDFASGYVEGINNSPNPYQSAPPQAGESRSDFKPLRGFDATILLKMYGTIITLSKVKRKDGQQEDQMMTRGLNDDKRLVSPEKLPNRSPELPIF